jgi:predicted 3-demethylubiquinone-9 3-methyltransferase (glyoxalase superfamily)
MRGITPCLWFDGCAEEAAAFYASVFPDSRVVEVVRAASDNPSTREGDVLLVQFTLHGQPLTALNGGAQFPFTEAISFQIECEDQAEVDRYWDALLADGGQESQCGWLKDRFGLSWQVFTHDMVYYLHGPDADGARRAMQAMMQMVKLDADAIRRAYEGADA